MLASLGLSRATGGELPGPRPTPTGDSDGSRPATPPPRIVEAASIHFYLILKNAGEVQCFHVLEKGSKK